MISSSIPLEVGDIVTVPIATTYDYDQPAFGKGRYNQLMQQYYMPEFSQTCLHHIREEKRFGGIIKIQEWGRCPIWYGKHATMETELCAHVRFARESKPHIVMLCHLARYAGE